MSPKKVKKVKKKKKKKKIEIDKLYTKKISKIITSSMQYTIFLQTQEESSIIWVGLSHTIKDNQQGH